MTAEELFEKMDRVKVTRAEIADRLGAFPHTITDIRNGVFELTERDVMRLSAVFDEIVEERLHGGKVTV